MITAQACQIEIQSGLGCQIQQASQGTERLRAGPIRNRQESPHLQMNPHYTGTELFHFTKVGDYFVPFAVPVVLDQPAGLVVIVIESPGNKPISGVSETESPAISRQLNALHWLKCVKGTAFAADFALRLRKTKQSGQAHCNNDRERIASG
jgi:hypothetical protein